MGFKPVHGNYDYEYNWDKEATLDEAVHLADKVHETLANGNVFYRLETV